MTQHLCIIALSTCFALLLLLITLNLKDVKKEAFKIKRTTLLLLLMVFALGFYTILLTPSLFFTLHDETFFLKYAKELSEGKFHPTDKSIGYPFLMALLFLFTGANFETAYAVNLALGSMSILLVFFVAYMFFGREDAGIYSSIFLTLFVPYLMAVRGLESNVAALFFLLLAMMCFLLYFNIRTFRSQLLAAVSLSAATYFRLEFIILPLLFAFLVMVCEKDLRKKLRSYRWWIPWVVLTILVTPWIVNTVQIALLPPEKNPYIHTSRMNYELLGLGALVKHLPYVRDLYVDAIFFPSFMILLLFLGPVYMMLKRRRSVVFLLLMFATFSLIYLSFDIPQNRYFLVPYLFVIMFWSGGISFLSELLQRFVNMIVKVDFSFPLLLIISVLIFSVFSPYVFELHRNPRSFTSPTGFFWEQKEVYLEREGVYYLNRNLDNCTIVTVDDEFFVFADLNPMRIEELLEKPEILNERRGCLLFFEDLYCKAPLAFQDDEGIAERYVSLCNKMHESFDLTTYMNFNVSLPQPLDSFTPKIIKGDWGGFTLYNISVK